jgi:hypothetical protein
MAIRSDRRSREPFGVPLSVCMRNRKLRNIRPSGVMKRHPVVTEGHSMRGGRGVRQRNRKLGRIFTLVEVPLVVFSRTSASIVF